MPEEKILDSQPETTQDQGEVSTPKTEGTTETIKTESNDSDQTALSQEGDIDYKTRYVESSKGARELLEQKKKLEEEKKAIEDRFTSFVTKDRQRLSDFLDDSGVSPEQKAQYLSEFDARNGKTQPTDGLSPFRQQAVDEAAKKLEAKYLNRKTASQRFVSQEENRNLSSETLNAIWSLAYKLEIEDGLEPETALQNARNTIVGRNESMDQSYAQGLSDGLLNIGSAPIYGGARGSRGSTPLPPAHEAFVNRNIREEGLTGQAAEDYRNRYIQRYLSKQLT